MLDIRFSSALRILLFLAFAAGEGPGVLSSAQLAEALDTSPSLVRRMLIPLVRAGLVESTRGRTGGTRLARPAGDITLAEIYRCSIGDKPLWACRPETGQTCLPPANTAQYFNGLTARAEDAVLSALGEETLADSLAAVWGSARVRLHEES
jgi:Rrf2 family transcriptional repressor of oqxAB